MSNDSLDTVQGAIKEGFKTKKDYVSGVVGIITDTADKSKDILITYAKRMGSLIG